MPADVLETELEMRMLINGVMAAVKSGSTDVDSLLFGDFFGTYDSRRVTGACRRYRGIIGMCEGIAQCNSRDCGLDWIWRQSRHWKSHRCRHSTLSRDEEREGN